MLSFITYKNIPEQIEIVGDSQGIQELIDYLETGIIDGERRFRACKKL